MAKQRLRKSRLARQALRPSGASNGKTETRIDGTQVTAGHKAPRETRIPASKPADIAAALAIDPSAKVQSVKRSGSRYRAHMLVYVDPAKVRRP